MKATEPDGVGCPSGPVTVTVSVAKPEDVLAVVTTVGVNRLTVKVSFAGLESLTVA